MRPRPPRKLQIALGWGTVSRRARWRFGRRHLVWPGSATRVPEKGPELSRFGGCGSAISWGDAFHRLRSGAAAPGGAEHDAEIAEVLRYCGSHRLRGGDRRDRGDGEGVGGIAAGVASGGQSLNGSGRPCERRADRAQRGPGALPESAGRRTVIRKIHQAPQSAEFMMYRCAGTNF